MKVFSCKCPECGAELNIDESREFASCSFCGAKIFLVDEKDNDNEKEIVNRVIDEAAVKKVENERIIELRKLEIEEKKKSNKGKTLVKIGLLLSVFGGLALLGYEVLNHSDKTSLIVTGCIVGVLALILMCLFEDDEQEKIDDGKVEIPRELQEYEKMYCDTVEAILYGAGFKSLVFVPLNDLNIVNQILIKPNRIESITIGGKEISAGDKYYPGETIVITYHSFG